MQKKMGHIKISRRLRAALAAQIGHSRSIHTYSWCFSSCEMQREGEKEIALQVTWGPAAQGFHFPSEGYRDARNWKDMKNCKIFSEQNLQDSNPHVISGIARKGATRERDRERERGRRFPAHAKIYELETALCVL